MIFIDKYNCGEELESIGIGGYLWLLMLFDSKLATFLATDFHGVAHYPIVKVGDRVDIGTKIGPPGKSAQHLICA